ncbi:MAG TPA: enoyl-CoA hydratase-related protein [Acidimicrobiia bacterium]|nr:enoyl-CoA hydratase-related protein [Acidimicrobiia bacterium]
MPIRWERDDDVGIAVIDRPERSNALSAELCEELHGHLDADGDLRAVVITGAGDRAFCAGADLARRRSDVGVLGHGGGDTFRPAFDALLASIVGYPSPVIAAINGTALGAGMQLAVACDLRVVAEHATFGIPSGRLGVLLSSTNIWRLATLVGQAMARDLLLTARILDIEEAHRVGLVQRRTDNALESAKVLAAELTALAPLSSVGHKRALNLVAEAHALAPPARAEIELLEAAAFRSADLQEGLTAFAEKRRPHFQGA